jgi:uncharacterized membrane protein
MNQIREHEPQWVDNAIALLLRVGVIVSMTVILSGLVLSFIHHPQYVRSRTALGTLTDARVEYPHRLRDVVGQVREGRGQAIVMLGLLLLIATPVSRVAFAVVAFAIERDRLYVAIAAMVLLLLLLSFLAGTVE